MDFHRAKGEFADSSCVKKNTCITELYDAVSEVSLGLSITGVVCGVRVENVENPTMREIRYLDKLIDELAKGKPMETVLRG